MGAQWQKMRSEMEDPTQHFGLTGQGLDGSTDFLDKDNKELKDMDKEIIRIEKEKSFAKWIEQEQDREQKSKKIRAKKRLERRAAPGKERERQAKIKEQLEQWQDSDDGSDDAQVVSPSSKKRQKEQKTSGGTFSRHKKKKGRIGM